MKSIFGFFRLGKSGEIDSYTQLVRMGRDEYKFCENDRCLLFQIELLKGSPDRLIYKSTMKKWLPPFENVEVSDIDRDRISTKVKEYWEAQGILSIIQ